MAQHVRAAPLPHPVHGDPLRARIYRSRNLLFRVNEEMDVPNVGVWRTPFGVYVRTKRWRFYFGSRFRRARIERVRQPDLHILA